MKFIAFTDPHGNEKVLDNLKKRSKEVDFMLCGGDITVFGNNIVKLLEKINSFHCKVFIIPGNHEDPDELEYLCDKYDNLVYSEDKVYMDEELLLFTSAGNGFARIDDYFEHVSEKFFDLLMKAKDDRAYIVMTHAPPYKTKLDPVNKEPCGNASIRSFIEFTEPLIAFSGHLHENEGKKDKLGKSIIVNPANGFFVEIIDKKIRKMEFI